MTTETQTATAAEGTACAVCGETEARLWRLAPDNLHGGKEAFRAVRCVRCGLVRLQPRPSSEEMNRYYATGTYARAEGEASESGLGKRLDFFFTQQAERAMAAHGGAAGRLLDVGCGDGRFLAAMAARDWRTEGIETDSVAADLARQRSGSVIHETPLEETDFADDTFDMVSLLHVLEHVPDPRATITIARRILKPGGILLLALPNAGSAEAGIFRNAWYPLDLPRHYWGFTPPTLTRLVEECGLTVSSLRYFPFLYALQSIRNVVRGGGTGSGSAGANRAEGGGLRTTLFNAVLTVSTALGKILPGEVMELTARKPAS